MSTQRETEQLLQDLGLEYLKEPSKNRRIDNAIATLAGCLVGLMIFAGIRTLIVQNAHPWPPHSIAHYQPTREHNPLADCFGNDQPCISVETSPAGNDITFNSESDITWVPSADIINIAGITFDSNSQSITVVGPSGKTFVINLETGETSGTLEVDEAGKIFAKAVAEELKK